MEDFNFYLCQNYLFVRVSAFYVSANSTRPNYCVWLMPAYFVFSVPNFFSFYSRILDWKSCSFRTPNRFSQCHFAFSAVNEKSDDNLNLTPLWLIKTFFLSGSSLEFFFLPLALWNFNIMCLGVSLLHVCRSALVKSFNMKILNFP